MTHTGHRIQQQAKQESRSQKMKDLASKHEPNPNAIVVTIEKPLKSADNKEKPQERSKKPEAKMTESGIRSWLSKSTITDWIVVIFTGVLTWVGISQGTIAKAALEATKDQVLINNRQLRVQLNDERAWLKITSLRIPTPSRPGDGVSPVGINVGQPVFFPLTIVNLGKSVAKSIDVEVYVQIVNSNEGPSLGWVENNPPHPTFQNHTGMFFPNDNHTIPAVRIGHNKQIEVATEDEVKGINSGSKFVVAFGRVTYDDIFHRRHWTKFCVPLLDKAGPYATGYCAEFNSEGEVRKDGTLGGDELDVDLNEN